MLGRHIVFGLMLRLLRRNNGNSLFIMPTVKITCKHEWISRGLCIKDKQVWICINCEKMYVGDNPPSYEESIEIFVHKKDCI